LKSKNEESIKQRGRDQHSDENYTRVIEEDLIYYKNLCKEYERSLNLNGDKNYERNFKSMNSERITNLNHSIYESLSNNSLKNNENNEYNYTSYTGCQPNQSLENFRRNKV
jgi:hypothetical protein